MLTVAASGASDPRPGVRTVPMHADETAPSW
jgi:hypothetical protein